MIYKNIIIKYDDEEFRRIRLIKIIDELEEDFKRDPSELIMKLEDNKGTLKIYWFIKVSSFLKNVVNSIWMDNYEFNTKHIISNYCPCCNASTQIEDKEIKEYLDSIQINQSL
jgi:hypothetical protein